METCVDTYFLYMARNTLSSLSLPHLQMGPCLIPYKWAMEQASGLRCSCHPFTYWSPRPHPPPLWHSPSPSSTPTTAHIGLCLPLALPAAPSTPARRQPAPLAPPPPPPPNCRFQPSSMMRLSTLAWRWPDPCVSRARRLQPDSSSIHLAAHKWWPSAEARRSRAGPARGVGKLEIRASRSPCRRAATARVGGGLCKRTAVEG